MTNLLQLTLAHEAIDQAHAHLAKGRRALDAASRDLDAVAHALERTDRVVGCRTRNETAPDKAAV